MFEFSVLPPLSLYIHIPWCVRKCPYCDFNSHEARTDLDEHAYVDALLADLEQELAEVWGRRVGTIFIGGGTPSLFSAEAIERLLAGVRARITVAPRAEITLEANPGTVERQRFAEFRAAGVNRLSLGIQSFNDTHLRRLGRIHGRDEALAAVEGAQRAGFDSLNLDLMFGLPEQTLVDAREDIATAIALGPDHLSYYQLTIEPNTFFHSRPPALPEHDDLWAIFQQGLESLGRAGYCQYEVSAHARPGRRCRHNMNYWAFGDYLGIGAGAHGKITSARDHSITRRWKVKHPRDYVQHAASPGRISGKSVLSPADAGFEFMLNALRLNEGFEPALFERHTGLPYTWIAPKVEDAIKDGYLVQNATAITCSDKGRSFLDDVLQSFLPS